MLHDTGKFVMFLSCNIPVVLDIIWRYRCSTVKHN